ncbi:DNA ligase LigA-related protein [Streptococcus pneumoniae]
MSEEEILELMNRRERQLLVHSFLYYQMNENIISDHTFDMWSKEMADLIKDHPEIFKQTVYYEGFQGFDGSTGAFLPFTLAEIHTTGHRILKYHKKLKGIG